MALDCSFMPRALSRTISQSTNMKPVLWRLSLYSRPGLPRPMMRKVSTVMCQVSRTPQPNQNCKNDEETENDQRAALNACVDFIRLYFNGVGWKRSRRGKYWR